MKFIVVAPLTLCIAIVANNARAASGSFAGVRDVSSVGGNLSLSGMSSDGSTLVGTAFAVFSPSAISSAFRWTKMSGLKPLGDMAIEGYSFESFATGASADGSVVVGWGSYGAMSYEAFRWTPETGMVGLGDLNGQKGLSAFSRAWGVSSDGRVIVGDSHSSSPEGGQEASAWNEGVIQSLGDFTGGGIGSRAHAVSANGGVVVGYGSRQQQGVASDGFIEASRWQNDAIFPLGGLPGSPVGSSSELRSIGLGVSADGLSVVGVGWQSGIVKEALHWKSGQIRRRGSLSLGSKDSIAFAASLGGRIIVGQSWLPAGEYGAFIWDEQHGMRDLRTVLANDFGMSSQLTGRRLTDAKAVSSDGRTFAGNGINPIGQLESWVATIQSPDINGDGLVNIFDVNVASDHWGQLGPTGDANVDGIVDIFDINLISDNWPIGAVPVPELATAALLVLAVLPACRLMSCRRYERESRRRIIEASPRRPTTRSARCSCG